MGLISKKSGISKKDIQVWKVMLKIRGKYYVCPPAYNLQKEHRILEYYPLGKILTANSEKYKSPVKDSREDGTVGAGFFHTFKELSDAMDFKTFLDNKYSLPKEGKIVILKALIPEGTLYHLGEYNRTGGYSYASQKIIYTEEMNKYSIKRFSGSINRTVSPVGREALMGGIGLFGGGTFRKIRHPKTSMRDLNMRYAFRRYGHGESGLKKLQEAADNQRYFDKIGL